MAKFAPKKTAAKAPEKVLMQIETAPTQKSGIIPCQLIYEGDPIEISSPVKSIKLIDGAVRWKCFINGREVELFNDGESWWMMQ